MSQIPLGEYPRPQMKRESYFCLNGQWQYAFSDKKPRPTKYDGYIKVPYSPECKLSGVGRALKPREYLHYRKEFTLPSKFLKKTTLLHFGAVDYFCECFVNGKSVGGHIGGFNAFSFDVSSVIHEGVNIIDVVVRDDSDSAYHTSSKQKIKRGGIWYTATSGIWQTVWMESVPAHYIKNLKITPLFDKGSVCVQVQGNTDAFCNGTVSVCFKGKTIERAKMERSSVEIALPSFEAWTPDNPALYDLEVIFGEDRVSSYFGMRKFSLGYDSDGFKRIFLNNQPIFMNGLLDQGYYEQGLLTPQNDQELISDIMLAKNCGYNTLRKHIKVESMRWYYHCDRLGMLVWQDMPSGGERQSKFLTLVVPRLNIAVKDDKYNKFGRQNPLSREEFDSQYREMIGQLYSVPCICMWVIFNEGWGQFDSRYYEKVTRELDKTRLIDHASGWFDQNGGDFCSKHVYFQKIKMPKDNRPVIVSEYGGYSLPVKDHVFSTRSFGYKSFETEEQLFNAYEKLVTEQVMPAVQKGLCAAIYTQLSDVEDETNGLVTFDRKKVKVDRQKMKKVNRALIELVK